MGTELASGCEVMVEPEHGNIRCPGHPLPKIGSKYPAGTECHIRCYKGYKLDGAHTRYCGKDGRWTGDSVTCVREYEQCYINLNTTTFPSMPQLQYLLFINLCFQLIIYC